MYDIAESPAAEKLNGDEGLEEMVQVFTKKTAVISPSMLPEIESFTWGEIKKEQAKLREQANSLLCGLCLPSEAKYIKKAIKQIAISHIWKSFGAQYDEISPELFELERILEVKSDEGNKIREVVIPLFASTPITEDKEWKIIKDWKDDNGYTIYKATITSKIPPITRMARDCVRKANVDFLNAYASALKEPVLGDWMMIEQSPACKFDMKLYWIPSPSELKITVEKRERDPIIIANIYDKNFLVAKWAVEGEEPFEHYLAEYKVR
jgi:hypothetical protein